MGSYKWLYKSPNMGYKGSFKGPFKGLYRDLGSRV